MNPKLQILIGVLCISVMMCGQVHYASGGVSGALQLGASARKPVMVLCYENWCQHCKFTREQVMTDRRVGEFLDEHFVCVEQDMNAGEGVQLNQQWRIQAYPTFVFFDSDGQLIYRVEGEKKVEALLAEAKNALEPKRQFPYLRAEVEKDTADGEACYNYVSALHRGGMDCRPVVERYFATQTDRQLLSELNWRVFTNGVTDFDSRMFRFVIAHQKEYGRIVAQARIRRKMIFEVRSQLTPLVETSDSVGYLKKRSQALNIGMYSTDSLVFTYDVFLWGLSKNWSRYRQCCLGGVEKYAWDNAVQLADICSNFLKNIPDKEATEAALNWSGRLLKLKTNYDNLMVASGLNLRLQRRDEALRWAEQALALATKSGWDGVEARQRIAELK